MLHWQRQDDQRAMGYGKSQGILEGRFQPLQK